MYSTCQYVSTLQKDDLAYDFNFKIEHNLEIWKLKKNEMLKMMDPDED